MYSLVSCGTSVWLRMCHRFEPRGRRDGQGRQGGKGGSRAEGSHAERYSGNGRIVRGCCGLLLNY